jgi:hypothetical protein
MEIKTKTEYHITLNDRQLKLVGLALAGKLKKRDDVAEARALNVELMEARAKASGEQFNTAIGALKHAEDKELEAPEAADATPPE